MIHFAAEHAIGIAISNTAVMVAAGAMSVAINTTASLCSRTKAFLNTSLLPMVHKDVQATPTELLLVVAMLLVFAVLHTMITLSIGAAILFSIYLGVKFLLAEEPDDTVALVKTLLPESKE